MSRKNLLIIGLVNQDIKRLGETMHFNRLCQYLERNFSGSVYSISLSCKNNKKQGKSYFIKYPKNKYLRILYWNIKLLFVSMNLIVKENVKIVYMRFNSKVFLQTLFFKLLKIRYCLEINGIPETKNRFLSFINQYIFSNAEFISGASGYVKYIKKTHKIDGSRFLEVSLGFDFDNVKIYNSFEMSNQLKLDFNCLYYIFIGNIQEYQGLSYIVKSIGLNKKHINKKIKFLFIGDGPYKYKLEEEVKIHMLSDLVIFIPRQSKENLDKYLSLNSIGLSPFSPNRGQPESISGLKTFDYLAHKMPIITSIMDEKSTLIENHQIGWVIKSYELNDIFNLIMKSFDEFEFMKKNLELRYKEYTKIYTWENRFKYINQKLSERINE